MRLSEKFALFVLLITTTLSSAVLMVALDRQGIIRLSRAPAVAVEPETPNQELAAVQASEVTLNTETVEKLPGRLPSELEPEPEPEALEGFAAAGIATEEPVAADAAPFETAALAPEPEIGEAWTTETNVNQQPELPRPQISAFAPQRPAPPLNGPGPVIPRSQSLQEKLAAISSAANKRLQEKFQAANIGFKPAEIGLVAIKDKKVLELHVRSANGPWEFVHAYPVLAASGGTGPKLRKGDMQVPEGIYKISFLNPNSKFHVALRVDYPNQFDRDMAARDGRSNLGGDIMIHGKNVSKGCLAIGDAAAEELFVLADSTGLSNIKLVIAPMDFRTKNIPERDKAQPQWIKGLYSQVATEMFAFKAPPPAYSLLSVFGL